LDLEQDMSVQAVAGSAEQSELKASWVPMIAIALGQMIMSFNVASLPVALGGMVKSFGVPPTTIATGIVAYGMLVAGFVMLGAKLNQRYGAARVFRAAVVLFCISQILMTLSPTATVMIAAQALCGASASVIVPSLVALIAENYKGRQQATAVGALGSARAAAGVLAFVIGGILGTYIGWRPVFGILIAVSAIVFLLSFRLKVDEGRPDVRIDVVGVGLAAAAIVLISFGFNNLNGWGLLLATANAPFNLLGLSPAPILIIVGIVLGQAFLMWTHRRQETGRTPLLALEVIDSLEERAAVYAMFSVVALEAALNFTVPLYIQIVQGRSPIATAIAMMPFNLTVFFTAMLIVRLYDRLTPRQSAAMASYSAPSASYGLPLSSTTIGASGRCSSASSSSASGKVRSLRWSSTCWSRLRRRNSQAMSGRCAAQRKISRRRWEQPLPARSSSVC
jgi:MFS family permease